MSSMYSQGKFQVGERVKIIGNGLNEHLGETGEIVGTDPFADGDIMALFNKSGTPHYYLVRLDKDETTTREMEHDLGVLTDTPVAAIDTTFKSTVDGIIRQLSKPENRDLLGKVVGHMGENDSFMFSFVTHEKWGFDEFCRNQHMIDMVVKSIGVGLDKPVEDDVRSMSVRYDEYLATDDNALNLEQSKRFNAIIEPFDDGWSGSVYGFVMRKVQYQLRTMMSN